MAMWIDRRGRKQYEQITTGEHGQTKIIRQSPTWYVRYRDADGIELLESTGRRDEQAARQVLADRLRRVEHVKARILTTDQNRQADHANRAMDAHISAYLEHLKAKTIRGKRVSAHHRRIADISRETMETWMNRRDAEGMSGRTRNTYRAAIVAFCNWCVESGRLSHNPLARLHKVDENFDQRHKRRAMTEIEITRLFKAAELRPIAELGGTVVPKAAHEKRGRSTWTKAEVTFDNLEEAYQRGLAFLEDKPARVAELKFLGRQRVLIYRTMICTGLRKSELASITFEQIHLDEWYPFIELLAKDGKAGRGSTIPLWADLATEFRQVRRIPLCPYSPGGDSPRYTSVSDAQGYDPRFRPRPCGNQYFQAR